MDNQGASEKSRQAERIIAKVQVKKITVGMVAMAAYLGHKAAREVAGTSGESPDDIKEWLNGLKGYGQEASARAIVGLARRVLPTWKEEPAEDPDLLEVPLHLVCTAEAWILCQTDMNSAHAFHLLDKFQNVPNIVADQDGCLKQGAMLSLAMCAAKCVTSRWEIAVEEVHQDACVLFDSNSIRQLIRAAVYPWALGISDPIADDPTEPDPD